MKFKKGNYVRIKGLDNSPLMLIVKYGISVGGTTFDDEVMVLVYCDKNQVMREKTVSAEFFDMFQKVDA